MAASESCTVILQIQYSTVQYFDTHSNTYTFWLNCVLYITFTLNHNKWNHNNIFCVIMFITAYFFTWCLNFVLQWQQNNGYLCHILLAYIASINQGSITGNRRHHGWVPCCCWELAWVPWCLGGWLVWGGGERCWPLPSPVWQAGSWSLPPLMSIWCMLAGVYLFILCTVTVCCPVVSPVWRQT